MPKRYRVGCKGLNEDGKGEVIFNNRKFWVSHFLPGEKGNIELVYGSKETGAKLVSLDVCSKDRIVPPCPVYETCGGCQLIHMNYEAQLEFKQGQMEKWFAQEAEEGRLFPILRMQHPWNYRHKVYASFSKGRHGEIIAGMYEEDSHRTVSTGDCMIQNPLANDIIKEIVRLMKQTHTPVYEEDKKTGVLRHVYIRVGEKTGQVMVVLVTGSCEFREKAKFVDGLRKKFPQITTILHNVNGAKTSMVLGKKETVLYGPGKIEDVLCGLTFEISPQSFYQVNPVQTELLYETAVKFAELSGKETVLDAYCGIGTIGMVAAKNAGKVIGVELNEAAVKDARRNAEKNHCRNISFIAADAGKYMTMLAGEKGGERPELVFMDPPRSGSSKEFLKTLCRLAPEKVVYISCNPATQKRDTDELKRRGYRIEKVQAVDCFCHTYHAESIVLLKKTGE